MPMTLLRCVNTAHERSSTEWGALRWFPKALKLLRKTPGAGAHCVPSNPHDHPRESFKRTLMAKRTLTVPMTLLCCVNTARERSIME